MTPIARRADSRPVSALMRQAEEIYDEVRRRIGDDTGNKPTGALGEAIGKGVYGADHLEPQSNKAFDLIAADGRRIQVKTRVLTDKTTMFGRQYHHDYDAVFLVALTPTYEVEWAVELTKQQALQCSGAPKKAGTSGAGGTNIRLHAVQRLRDAQNLHDLTQEAQTALAAL